MNLRLGPANNHKLLKFTLALLHERETEERETLYTCIGRPERLADQMYSSAIDSPFPVVVRWLFIIKASQNVLLAVCFLSDCLPSYLYYRVDEKSAAFDSPFVYYLHIASTHCPSVPDSSAGARYLPLCLPLPH